MTTPSPTRQVTEFERQLLTLSFAMQDAMSKPEHAVGPAPNCRNRLAQGVAEIDILISADRQHENAFGHSCWELRASEGSLVDVARQEFYPCLELERGGQVTLNTIAALIEDCEPGLAETARSLADQSGTAVEQYEEIVPDAWDIWANTPTWLKGLGMGLGLLLLLNAANLVKK